jgi:hypothetical protein
MGNLEVESKEHCQQHAREARGVAELFEGAAKDLLHRIAKEWDALADHAERAH